MHTLLLSSLCSDRVAGCTIRLVIPPVLAPSLSRESCWEHHQLVNPSCSVSLPLQGELLGAPSMWLSLLLWLYPSPGRVAGSTTSLIIPHSLAPSLSRMSCWEHHQLVYPSCSHGSLDKSTVCGSYRPLACAFSVSDPHRHLFLVVPQLHPSPGRVAGYTSCLFFPHALVPSLSSSIPLQGELLGAPPACISLVLCCLEYLLLGYPSSSGSIPLQGELLGAPPACLSLVLCPHPFPGRAPLCLVIPPVLAPSLSWESCWEHHQLGYPSCSGSFPLQGVLLGALPACFSSGTRIYKDSQGFQRISFRQSGTTPADYCWRVASINSIIIVSLYIPHVLSPSLTRESCWVHQQYVYPSYSCSIPLQGELLGASPACISLMLYLHPSPGRVAGCTISMFSPPALAPSLSRESCWEHHQLVYPSCSGSIPLQGELLGASPACISLMLYLHPSSGRVAGCTICMFIPPALAPSLSRESCWEHHLLVYPSCSISIPH